MAGILLGLVFLVAGFGKLPAQTEAYTILFVIRKEPVLLWLSDYIHILVPSVELFLGFLLVSGIAARITALVSIPLVGVFIFNNLWFLHKGIPQESCGCFGDAVDRLLGGITTTQSLYVDLAMVILIFLVVAFYPNRWFGLRPWFLSRLFHKYDRVFQ